jgi:hypothetical protein
MVPGWIENALKQKDKQVEALYLLADRLATLSAGALALTVTFRGDLAKPNPHVWLLKASWLGFILAILGFVIISKAKIDFHCDAFEKMSTSSPNQLVMNLPWRWYFHFGRYLLFGGFFAGIILLALYGVKR